jgi:hypothetical protein
MGLFRPKTEDEIAEDIKRSALDVAWALANDADTKTPGFQDKLEVFGKSLSVVEKLIRDKPVDSVSPTLRCVLSSVGSVTGPLYLGNEFLRAAAIKLVRDLSIVRPNPFGRFAANTDAPTVP